MAHKIRIEFLVLTPKRSVLFLRWALKGFKFPAIREDLERSSRAIP